MFWKRKLLAVYSLTKLLIAAVIQQFNGWLGEMEKKPFHSNLFLVGIDICCHVKQKYYFYQV